ncbi:MAG: hypothetical protein VX642_04035 [Bdellovibrionota bacterium]|nr:hypothetical protein [Bdellovibrionota bacterium]
MKLSILLLMSSMFLAACASSSVTRYKPILANNKKFQEVGFEGSEKDVGGCISKVDAHYGQYKSDRTKRAAVRGAVKGAGFGTIVGLATGAEDDFLQTTAGGAVLGAGAATYDEQTRSHLYQDTNIKSDIAACLVSKGYEINGWR